MTASRPILVTGSSGFVGGWLLKALAQAGEGPVVGLDQGASRGHPLDGFEQLSLLDEPAVQTAIARWRPRAVCHLAGQASVADSLAEPTRAFEANALGTLRLLEALRRHAPDARVVLVSSAEVYGDQVEGAVPETAPLRAGSPYAASKLALEALGQAWWGSYGLPVVVARPFNHTGPGQSDRFVASAFARQLAAIEAGRQPPVLHAGALEPRRDFLDVRDVASAYVHLLKAGEPGRAYNICRGEATRIGDVLAQLLALARVGVEVVSDPARARTVDPPVRWGDPSALQAATGWHPTIPWKQTLHDLLEAWRATMPMWGDAPSTLA
ncbi:MAG: GDP-mannose 4,6-dehydratase [Candidatus Sericytochromatia bacterium]|nr:GDP-mannose 4,6-dehydratase [Candidatus Sericytochromatia bacterium]